MELSRERWIGFFKAAHQNALHQGLSPIDWDSDDSVRVVVNQGGPLLVPSASPEGGHTWLLILPDGETFDSWNAEVGGEAWPYFEDEVRDTIASLD